eukprot:RCo039072
MSGRTEIAEGDRHHHQWLNFSLAHTIPSSLPMGENLKAEWTATGERSPEPLVVTLTDRDELHLEWQEYRWVTELEALGQLYLYRSSEPGKPRLVRMTEQLCLKTEDPQRPYRVYSREDQKSIVVTSLVAAITDPAQCHLSVEQDGESVYEVAFDFRGRKTRLGIDVEAAVGLVCTTNGEDFPEEEVNERSEDLADPFPSEGETLRRVEHSVESSQAQKSLNVSFAKREQSNSYFLFRDGRGTGSLDETSAARRFEWKGRLPPFDPSGKKRIDKRNKFIKAPFKDLTVHGLRAASESEELWEKACRKTT